MTTWDQVVAICERELPEVERSTSYGTPALKVRSKLFVRLKEDSSRIVVFCDFMEREALVQGSPGVYVVTDHYRDYPMVLIKLDVAPEDELRELLVESWRQRAPKTLVKEFDAGERA